VDDLRAKLLRRLAPYGQEHILRFWDELDDTARARLAQQVASLDLELIDELVRTRLSDDRSGVTFDFGPVEVTGPPRTDEERSAYERAREVGGRLLREGRAACVVVAGGQGTRLGYDGPKGTFPIGPVSQRSIFQLHVEKIRALGRRHDTHIPLFVMTSVTNDEATRTFFERNGNFGLPDEDVFFFVQGMVPAVDLSGRLILDAPGHVFQNPNGHGGVLSALVDSGGTAEMKGRGITDIFHFQVDNVLVDPAEPVFLGFHHLTGAEMSSKVTPKRNAEEPVGVTVRRSDGRTAVVEYMDLGDEQARRKAPDGSLLFAAANLCIFWYTVDFVEAVDGRGGLPYHLARKKVPAVDENGKCVEPTEPNGVKFETFVFDALPQAERTFLMEIDRAEEFAPVKNATGEDSVASARQAMTERSGRWLESCGVEVPRRKDGLSLHPVEISPLYALDAEELKSRLPDRLEIDGPLLLEN